MGEEEKERGKEREKRRKREREEKERGKEKRRVKKRDYLLMTWSTSAAAQSCGMTFIFIRQQRNAANFIS